MDAPAGSMAQGGAKASSFRARISVRRHSSSRAPGQGKARNRANASRRRSTSHAGSSRPLRKRSKASSVKPPAVGVRVVPDALLMFADLIQWLSGSIRLIDLIGLVRLAGVVFQEVLIGDLGERLVVQRRPHLSLREGYRLGVGPLIRIV